MSNLLSNQLLQVETKCGTLLCELQIIWDEVGESDEERNKLLFQLEQECLEVYRRKIDQANKSRTQLQQAIADSEAELAAICSAMGERPVHHGKKAGSLKEELRDITPQLEEMRKKKNERRNQFLGVIEKIQHIFNEIRPAEFNPCKNALDESDLSIKRLEDLHMQLQSLQKEKSDRLNQVLDYLGTLKCLCLVLGMDFKKTVSEVHHSLEGAEVSVSISNETIERLASAVHRLREIKIQRMQRVQDFAIAMLELWNLMDTPIVEQQMFRNVTCNVAATPSAGENRRPTLGPNGARKQHDKYGNETTGKKTYSRDFLLTLSEQCTQLPIGFEIGSDVVNAVMSCPVASSYVVDHKTYPSPGRSVDRSSGSTRVDRRTIGIVDDDRWTKLPGAFGPGQEIRHDIGHGATAMNLRPGQGITHGVLRNPRGQPSGQNTDC